ncbi:MAG: hypothetical protein M3Y49_08390 [Actinomycetota bacterium]|nr:hypothetical protein [Actinomycetota bacterium]
MDVHRVDPRDQTWEIVETRYRVYFHDSARRSDEYEISGADIFEVIAWADAQKLGRTYVLYACVPDDGLGLVRLAGTDPNEEGGVTWEFTVPGQ